MVWICWRTSRAAPGGETSPSSVRNPLQHDFFLVLASDGTVLTAFDTARLLHTAHLAFCL